MNYSEGEGYSQVNELLLCVIYYGILLANETNSV
jgi:hypothetical protein